MFIEQLTTKKINLRLYLFLPLCFLAVIVMNYISTKDVDVDELLQVMIQQLGANVAFVLLLAPLSFGCLFLLFWVKYVHHQSLRSLTTSRSKVDWNRVLFSFSVWGLITIGGTLLLYVVSPESLVWNFKPGPFFTFLLLALLLIPLQTSFEEYFFRGYLMQGIGVATKSRLVPLVVTSVAFGLMHIANPEVGKMGAIIMIYYIGTGFFLGIITLMDDGIELSLGFHAANNLVGALLVTADWTAFQTHSIFKDVSTPSAGFDVLFPVSVIFPILLLIFGKKYGWSRWKEKLTGKLTVISDTTTP